MSQNLPVPTISTVMPVRNADRYLGAAVGSILAQTFDDFELLAVDDGSTDNSLRLLQAFAAEDERIHVISLAPTGIVGTLNVALAMARGKFIARMDADDIAFPERFMRQIAYLAEHPGCVAVGSATLHVDPDGDPIHVERWPETHDAIDAQLMRGRGGLAHPAAMIRANALRHVGGYRIQYQWVEDMDLWMRLAEIGQLANLSEVLLAYRLHNQSICSTRGEEQYRLVGTLLNETYARRQLHQPVPRRPSYRKRTTTHLAVRHRWIRMATRAGYIKTAVKHTRQVVRQQPLSPSTWLSVGRVSLTKIGHMFSCVYTKPVELAPVSQVIPLARIDDHERRQRDAA